MQAREYLTLTAPFVSAADAVTDVGAWFNAVTGVNAHVLREFKRMSEGRPHVATRFPREANR